MDFGGMGDIVNRLPAVRYIYETWPYVTQKLYVYDYMEELYKLAVEPMKTRVQVQKMSLFESHLRQVPNIPTVSFYPHSSTGMKLHLTEVGFIFLCDKIPRPETGAWDLPQPDLTNIDISEYNLPERYGVLCTNYTAPVRAWPTHEVEEVAKWMISQKITPVFLGSKDMPLGIDEKVPVSGSALSLPEGSIDLRDSTNLTQALKVMSNAKFVAGCDNGLLHLASLSNVTTIWGFTTVEPEQRLPYRQGSQRYKALVVGQPESLSCRYCQSRQHFIYHDYKKCIYEDYACTKNLTAGQFIDKIKLAIGFKGPGAAQPQLPLSAKVFKRDC